MTTAADKKPRKLRTDNPASFLPSGPEAFRIARERGKTAGKPRGSRAGWTKAERVLEWELARSKARIEVAFFEATGEWAVGEALQVLYRAIDPELLFQVDRMRERRAARISRPE